MKARLTIIFTLIALLVIGVLWSVVRKSAPNENNNPEPDKDVAANGNIKLFSPLPNGVIHSPVSVRGEARGNWYFEASFPVRLEDANGKIIIQTHAEAKGDWMTTNFVQFELDLSFGAPQTDTGFLVLENDNPSGLPENHKELRIPVRFK